MQYNVRSSTFLAKKSAPRQNPGYAYAYRHTSLIILCILTLLQGGGGLEFRISRNCVPFIARGNDRGIAAVVWQVTLKYIGALIGRQ